MSYRGSARPYSNKVKPVSLVQHQTFSYDENHQVIVIDADLEDITASVNSHKDEVGLVNIIKMAVARGVNPADNPFALKDNESMLETPDIETLGDVQKAREEALKQLAEISKKLGITPTELEQAYKSGKINDVVDAAASKETIKEGENK